MSRAVGADGRTNRRTPQFREMFTALPANIRELADLAFKQFLADPSAKALRLHQLKNVGKGQHLDSSWSVSVNRQYRAIFVVDAAADQNVWYWIGSHADYDRFTGVK